MADRVLTPAQWSALMARAAREMPTQLQRLLDREADRTAEDARLNASPGGVSGLRIITGHLRASIHGEARQGREGPELVVYAGDQWRVVYAAIHEYGGTLPRGLGGRIRPRPFVAPAMADAEVRMRTEVPRVVAALLDGEGVARG